MSIGISFYTPVLGFVHISSRPYLLECVDDISYLAVCTDESQDHIGIDDIQEDAVGSFEDLVSLGTEKLDNSANVFDTLYVDMSFRFDSQDIDCNTLETSDFEDTPLDSTSEEVCRRQSSQCHHVSNQLRVSDRDIAITCQHFDATHQLLAVYGWGSPTSDEQEGNYLSLTEIHSLWEAIRILR